MFFSCTMKSAAGIVFMVAVLLPAVLGSFDHEKEVNFFMFGPDVEDSQLNKGDEAGALLSLKVDFVFYDKKYSRIVVYDNGYLGIGSTTGSETPFSFPLKANAPSIAAFWADTDTTTTGTVYYRETQEAVYLDAVNSEIRAVYGGSFAATSMVIVTWDEVGYCCNSPPAQNNSYQALLVTNGSFSYVFLRYWDIQWTTGDRSGGVGGRGGSHAVAGLNAGDGLRYISIRGSAMEDVENINTRSNIGNPGIYVFRTDPSIVSPGPFIMFPFGGSSGDTTLATGDGANSGLVSLSTNAVVYDKTVKEVIVSEDGYISADGQLKATTPTAFPYEDDFPIIAPFWADVARSSSQGAVYYRETTDSTLLAQAEYYVLLANGGSFSPTSLFIVTWDGVGREPDDFTQINTFQAVIATDANEGVSFVIFLYDSITWTASARTGINEGNGKNSFSLPGSGTSQLEDLDVTSNAGIPGIYVLNTGRASLYPYGPTMSDRTLGMVDDHSLFVQLRRSTYPFYGTSHSNLRVYSNGYISMGGSYGGFCPNPDSLKEATRPLIAPFFADADVSSSYYLYNQGGVFFRETSDICLLDRAAAEVNSLVGDTSFRPTSLVIATWDHVGYSKMNTDKLNTFQVVMTTDGTTSYIFFLYGAITWTASDPCGGVDGIGGDGNSAQVGVTAGDGVRFFSLPTSGTANIITIDDSTNCGMPGLYVIPTNSETPAKVSSYKETAYVDTADLISELANEKKVYRYQDNGPSNEPDSSIQDNIDWESILKSHPKEENGRYAGEVNRGNVAQVAVKDDDVKNARYQNYQTLKYNYDRYRNPGRHA